MCKKCVIFTYDEVLDIVMKLEVGAPLNFNPDWPVRTTEAYPNSVAPLIVPAFDMAAPAPATILTAESSTTPLPTFAPGLLGVREHFLHSDDRCERRYSFHPLPQVPYHLPKGTATHIQPE